MYIIIQTFSYEKSINSFLSRREDFWTGEVSQSIEEHDLAGRLQKLSDQMKDLVGLVRGQLSQIRRMILTALIVIDVHDPDVCGTLVNEDAQTVNDL